MAWFVLIVSGMFEAVWASALAASEGFTRIRAVILFFITLIVSMVGLSWAMSSLPTGTAYAVWVGIGATLTAGWAMVTGAEKATIARVLLLVLLVGSVAGLKAVT